MAGVKPVLAFAIALTALALPACRSVPPELAARDARILEEPRGDYWIGRRVATERTRYWGYVRRPGQLWSKAELVVFNESQKYAPDRLPEHPPEGQKGFQYDNNSEYRLRGRLTGRKVYDPNSDKILPEFLLQDYELLTASPGFLFHPREKRNYLGLPVPPR